MTLHAIPVPIIFGATACGKTDIAEKLFAENSDTCIANNIEIISADSVQVYHGLTIGSAQPSAALLNKLPHHLINVCRPDKEFSVADFVQNADRICKNCIERGKMPVIVGGTAFYIKHFMYGLPITPQADEYTRSILQQRTKDIGNEAMLEDLKTFDPVSAKRIHVHDTYRIIRAHEVYIATGKPLSSFSLSCTHRQGYCFCPIFLDRKRSVLYDRIEARVEAMFITGLQHEIQLLTDQGYTADSPAMKAIGYREFFQLNPEEPAAADRCSAENLIKRNTKQYAKRQQTFFRSLPNTYTIDMDEIFPEKAAAQLIINFYRENMPENAISFLKGLQ